MLFNSIFNEKFYSIAFCFSISDYLRGGTCDVAIVSINSLGIYHVRSTNGNTRLGGAKLTDILMKFCLDKLKESVMPIDMDMDSLSAMGLSMLRNVCEEAKKELSKQNDAEITVFEEKISISRGEYERLITPFVDKTIQCVINALEDADLESTEISKVILVGGGSYTPLGRTSLESLFKKSVNTDVNPMEAGIAHFIYLIYYIFQIYFL